MAQACWVWSTLLFATVALAADERERPKLIVLDLARAGDVGVEVATALTDALAAEASKRRYFQVVTSREIATLLGLERQKQLLGCSEDSSNCLTELAGALGAQFVLSGSVVRYGDSFQLSLQSIDSRKAQSLGRTTRLAKDLQTLRAQVPYAFAEATGIPPPAEPSRLLPYSLLGGGGALLTAAALFSLQTSAQEELLRKELELGVDHPSVLKPMGYYEDEQAKLQRDKHLALGAAIAGAIAAAAGVYLLPEVGGAASVALVPTANGVALAGVLR